MNIEGNVYLCDKKKKWGKYRLELQENRDIKTSGYDLELCKVEIYEQILDAYGDGEAVLEFIPEKSKKLKTGTYLYTELGYNESVDILNENSLFEGGICPKCSYGIGDRTEELLNLERKPKNNLVSITYKKRKYDDEFNRVFPKVNIYSKKFLNLFTKDEKLLFDTKSVLLKGKESEYVELIPKKIVLHSGHKGAQYPTEYLQSWRCSECKRENYLVDASNIYRDDYIFLNPNDIRDSSTMFFMSQGMHTSLVVRTDRWAQLLQHKKETKGIVTNPVVILEEKYVEYPQLEEPEKFEW